MSVLATRHDKCSGADVAGAANKDSIVHGARIGESVRTIL
jgi:hypothetical protein